MSRRPKSCMVNEPRRCRRTPHGIISWPFYGLTMWLCRKHMAKAERPRQPTVILTTEAIQL